MFKIIESYRGKKIDVEGDFLYRVRIIQLLEKFLDKSPTLSFDRKKDLLEFLSNNIDKILGDTVLSVDEIDVIIEKFNKTLYGKQSDINQQGSSSLELDKLAEKVAGAKDYGDKWQYVVEFLSSKDFSKLDEISLDADGSDVSVVSDEVLVKVSDTVPAVGDDEPVVDTEDSESEKVREIEELIDFLSGFKVGNKVSVADFVLTRKKIKDLLGDLGPNNDITLKRDIDLYIKRLNHLRDVEKFGGDFSEYSIPKIRESISLYQQAPSDDLLVKIQDSHEHFDRIIEGIISDLGELGASDDISDDVKETIIKLGLGSFLANFESIDSLIKSLDEQSGILMKDIIDLSSEGEGDDKADLSDGQKVEKETSSAIGVTALPIAIDRVQAGENLVRSVDNFELAFAYPNNYEMGKYLSKDKVANIPFKESDLTLIKEYFEQLDELDLVDRLLYVVRFEISNSHANSRFYKDQLSGLQKILRSKYWKLKKDSILELPKKYSNLVFATLAFIVGVGGGAAYYNSGDGREDTPVVSRSGPSSDSLSSVKKEVKVKKVESFEDFYDNEVWSAEQAKSIYLIDKNGNPKPGWIYKTSENSNRKNYKLDIPAEHKRILDKTWTVGDYKRMKFPIDNGSPSLLYGFYFDTKTRSVKPVTPEYLKSKTRWLKSDAMMSGMFDKENNKPRNGYKFKESDNGKSRSNWKIVKSN